MIHDLLIILFTFVCGFIAASLVLYFLRHLARFIFNPPPEEKHFIDDGETHDHES